MTRLLSFNELLPLKGRSINVGVGRLMCVSCIGASCIANETNSVFSKP